MAVLSLNLQLFAKATQLSGLEDGDVELLNEALLKSSAAELFAALLRSACNVCNVRNVCNVCDVRGARLLQLFHHHCYLP